MNAELDSETEQISRSGSGEGFASGCLSSFFVILRMNAMICTKTSERYDASNIGKECQLKLYENNNGRF